MNRIFDLAPKINNKYQIDFSNFNKFYFDYNSHLKKKAKFMAAKSVQKMNISLEPDLKIQIQLKTSFEISNTVSNQF